MSEHTEACRDHAFQHHVATGDDADCICGRVEVGSGHDEQTEDSYPFYSTDGHTPYLAANLLQALTLVPDTGDWHGEMRLWAERHLDESVPPNPLPPGRPDGRTVAAVVEWLRNNGEEAMDGHGYIDGADQIANEIEREFGTSE
jgi:hypothetical protein